MDVCKDSTQLSICSLKRATVLGTSVESGYFYWRCLNLHYCSLWTTKFYTFVLYRPCIFPLHVLHSHHTSLFTISISSKYIKQQQQQQQQSQKHFLSGNKSMREWNPQKPAKQGRMTLQYFNAIPTSCAILACNIATHHKTLYMHINLFTPTKWMRNYITSLTPQCSLHSLLHIPATSAILSSN